MGRFKSDSQGSDFLVELAVPGPPWAGFQGGDAPAQIIFHFPDDGFGVEKNSRGAVKRLAETFPVGAGSGLRISGEFSGGIRETLSTEFFGIPLVDLIKFPQKIG